MISPFLLGEFFLSRLPFGERGGAGDGKRGKHGDGETKTIGHGDILGKNRPSEASVIAHPV